MKLEIDWLLSVERTLFVLPPSLAERIVDAVDEFATHGRGFVRVVASGERRLYVKGAYVVLELDGSTLRPLHIVASDEAERA